MSIVPSSEMEDFESYQEFNRNNLGKAKEINKDDEWYYADQTHVSNSHLKILGNKGPLHLHNYFKNGQEDTSAFAFGRAMHCIVLEPEEFDKRYYILDDTEIKKEIGGARPTTTKLYKEFLNAEQEIALNTNREILTLDDYDKIKAMKEALDNIPEVDALLKNTLKEKILSNVLIDVPCKIKVDAIKAGQYIVDYKTTNEPANKKNFTRDLFKYGYDHQAAFYCDNSGVERFIFIVQEKNYPYSIMIAEASEDTLASGRAKYQANLLQYKKYFFDNDPNKTLQRYYSRVTI